MGKGWENLNKKRNLRNKNVNNYECLLKRMLYCPGNGQELLSAVGVTLVCHASNGFLVLKVPLSIIDPFSKSMAWLLDQAWLLAILEPLAAVFGVSQMLFFSGIESSAGFPNITPRTTCTGNFIHDVGLRFHRRSEFQNFRAVVVEW